MRNFRGKPVAGGEMVKGWYWYNEATGQHYIRQTNFQPAEFDYTDYEVIPSSVGQSTGRNDTHGVEAFGGDKVKSKHYDGIGTVTWWGNGWAVVVEGDSLKYSLCYEFEIIGNTTDNPGLLENDK